MEKTRQTFQSTKSVEIPVLVTLGEWIIRFGNTRQAEETLSSHRISVLIFEVVNIGSTHFSLKFVNIGSHHHETREEGEGGGGARREGERSLELSRWTFLVEISPMFDQWAEGLSCPFPD